MYEGTICSVRLDKGFGFIRAVDQPDTFFHHSDLVELEFDERLQEQRVKFDIVSTGKGPRARNVQAAG
jgi:cold shock CspA family protein